MPPNETPGQMDWIQTVGELDPQQGLHGSNKVSLSHFRLVEDTLPQELFLLLHVALPEFLSHGGKLLYKPVDDTVNMNRVPNEVLHDSVQLSVLLLNRRTLQYSVTNSATHISGDVSFKLLKRKKLELLNPWLTQLNVLSDCLSLTVGEDKVQDHQ